MINMMTDVSCINCIIIQKIWNLFRFDMFKVVGNMARTVDAGRWTALEKDREIERDRQDVYSQIYRMKITDGRYNVA